MFLLLFVIALSLLVAAAVVRTMRPRLALLAGVLVVGVISAAPTTRAIEAASWTAAGVARLDGDPAAAVLALRIARALDPAPERDNRLAGALHALIEAQTRTSGRWVEPTEAGRVKVVVA